MCDAVSVSANTSASLIQVLLLQLVQGGSVSVDSDTNSIDVTLGGYILPNATQYVQFDVLYDTVPASSMYGTVFSTGAEAPCSYHADLDGDADYRVCARLHSYGLDAVIGCAEYIAQPAAPDQWRQRVLLVAVVSVVSVPLCLAATAAYHWCRKCYYPNGRVIMYA